MSGTSMDGVDAALLETDGTSTLIQPREHVSLAYDTPFKKALRFAERIVFQKNGRFSSDLLQDITAESTQWHANAVFALLKKAGIPASHIDVTGYHGQTLLHRPAEGISVIIGDGQKLADTTGITVVNDFRTADMQAGGQGAPLAPLYHHALAVQSSRMPLAIVNCGGIANITLIRDREQDSLRSFDTGPGNVLIDRLVRQRTGNLESMDKDGRYGRRGKIHQDILNELHETALCREGCNYLLKPPPKSLDTHDMILPSSLETLSLEDACATLERFTAETIVQSLTLLDDPPPEQWILAGGGWNNPVILSELRRLLEERIGPALVLQTADEAGWQSQAMEAQLFAWLAVRSLKGLPLSLPQTTGVLRPMPGGKCYLAAS